MARKITVPPDAVSSRKDVVDSRSEDDDYEVHMEGLKRRSTKDSKPINWQTEFKGEPLYQTYRQTIILKEIKCQTAEAASSQTDSEYESITSIPEEFSSSGWGSNPQLPRNTLWQNLRTVRESGVLGTMSGEERKLQESMFEVLTSEASYLKSLNVLVDHFENSKELNETIILRDKEILFSSINRVKDVSERFLEDMEARVEESVRISDVCDIIHHHAQKYFQIYINYVRNQLYQEQKYSHLMESNSHFAAVIVRLQELPDCQRLPLMSFLLLPFQRITRIKMLIENILQKTKEGSTNEENATKALGVVSKIIDECSAEVGKMKQMEELIDIAKKLEFDKLKAIPIISQARYLEKRGEITEISQRGNLFGMKPKSVALYLFLFNDLLLITSRKSADRYLVMDHAHRSMVEVHSCTQSSERQNCFLLTLIENHQGKQLERLVKVHTQSDLQRWLDALPAHKLHSSESFSDEKIYEQWDCPQVQCLVAYTAQQADELSLEPADLVNVTRKTPEGWYEGTKLSTGKKGWFPSTQVREITDEHVRRRNLRDRSRLLRAAQELQRKHRPKEKKRNVVSL
ncbi:rho guanine nucleotide exchange factor 15 [Callorhinchus milii]|uniref:rho guanine nucleotide exchange factor 15 n=1 Tax=Callorhinchus milii TaxID=7868 RepID=UPI001C3FE605|nr:rho guanine nucleotide exchange factor 15 [Callorhinchus milii]